MAPFGCHNSESAMRLCKDSFLASNPPSVDSASGRSTLNVLKHVSTTHLPDFSLGEALHAVAKAFGQGLAKTPDEIAKRQVMRPLYTTSNAPDPNKTDFTKTSTTQIVLASVFGGLIGIGVLFLIGACIRAMWTKYYRSFSKESNHDWEYRSQDRANKSLRWKTLKKDGPGQEKGAGEGAREERGAADVEALAGVKITPLKVWSITSHPSTDSVPPPEKTRWEKMRVMVGFGAKENNEKA